MLTGRNLGVDLLRIISVIAVVVGHAWPFMPGEEYLQIWRMPLFFFLAGYFLSESRTFQRELSTRWRTLGIPYLVWLGVLSGLVVAHHFTPMPFNDTWDTIGGALFGGGLTDMPFLAFWFISVLFFAVLFARVLLHRPWWVQLSAAVAGLGLAQIPYSAMSYTALGVGLVPACTAFVLAGLWFRRAIASGAAAPLMRSPRAGVWGLLLTAAGIGGVAAGAGTMNVKWSGFGTFLISPLLAVLICIGLTVLFATWVHGRLQSCPRISQVISALVSTGTLVVFLHPYVLFLAWDALAPPGRVLLALTVCWTLGLVLNRTRLSPYVTGLPRPVRQPSAVPA